MDRADWDARYLSELNCPDRPPRYWLTSHEDVLMGDGVCLEPAMGLGWNFPFLLSLGYRVWGVELSRVAARFAARQYPAARIIQGDLSQIRFPPAVFDLISHFYFLGIDLINSYSQIIKPGGVIILETLTIEMLSFRPETPPDRLLQPGQLKTIFRDWTILDYREGWFEERPGHPKSIASIVARKP